MWALIFLYLFFFSLSFSCRSSARLIIGILSRMVPEEGGRSEGGFYKEARPIRLLQRQRPDWLSLRYTAVLQQWRRARGVATRRAASSRGYVPASRVRLWADAPDAAGRVRERGDDVATLWNSASRPRFRRGRDSSHRESDQLTRRSESARNVKRACASLTARHRHAASPEKSRGLSM